MFILLEVKINHRRVVRVTLYDVLRRITVELDTESRGRKVHNRIRFVGVCIGKDTGYCREIWYSPSGVQVRFGRCRYIPQPEEYRRMVYTGELDGPGALMVGGRTEYQWKEWKKIEEVKFDASLYDLIELFNCCSQEKLNTIVPVRLQGYYVTDVDD